MVEPEALPDYTFEYAISKAGYHHRRAWRAQAFALGTGFVGGGLMAVGLYNDRPRLVNTMFWLTATGILACEIAAISHQMQRGKVLEFLPGGVRYTF